ncbi:MAG: hypothetical protein JXQ76_13010 [Campylobacterales bacterium]|nr:hypothetical protein [Campylobacterales bacterium]
MKRFLLILSAIFTSVVADNTNEEKKSGGNGEVNSNMSVGNGEVSDDTIKSILNKIYVDGKFYIAFINDALYAMSDRSGGNTRSKDINRSEFANEKVFVIVLQKPMSSQEPLKSNIHGTQFKSTQGMTFIHIPVKNIKDKILISNKEGQKLIEYTVVK